MPSDVFPITWIPDVLVKRGWMFVEFFFIISGYLFAYTQKSRICTCDFKTYFLGRLKRLYPSVLFITVFDVLVRFVNMIVNNAGDRLTLASLIKSLTFTSTWIYKEEPFPTVLWYIHVLFLCYLIYYFIAKSKNNTRYLTGVIILFFAGWTMYAKDFSIPFLYKNIGRGYLAFSVGLLLHEFQISASEKTRKTVSYCALAAAVCSLAAAFLFTFEKFFGDLLLCCTLFLFPAAMLCLLNISWIRRIFSVKPLVWLGKLSMSTFLVHVPVMNLVNALFKRSGLLSFDRPHSFIIVLIIIFAFSAAWHYLIELKLTPKFLSLFKR